jgi:hypothetical protein
LHTPCRKKKKRTGREYAAADARWGTADPTVVSLEVLTVLGAGPLAALIVYQIVKRDPARHHWIVVLSTAELYGGCVFFFFFFPLAGERERQVPPRADDFPVLAG